jgi:Response regulator receiver domain
VSNTKNRVSAHVVLVVEDEFLIRMAAVEALLGAGFVVIEAAHAGDALALLQSRATDIHARFTDVQMPGDMDGVTSIEFDVEGTFIHSERGNHQANGSASRTQVGSERELERLRAIAVAAKDLREGRSDHRMEAAEWRAPDGFTLSPDNCRGPRQGKRPGRQPLDEVGQPPRCSGTIQSGNPSGIGFSDTLPLVQQMDV